MLKTKENLLVRYDDNGSMKMYYVADKLGNVLAPDKGYYSARKVANNALKAIIADKIPPENDVMY